jgi:hypothetical protein
LSHPENLAEVCARGNTVSVGRPLQPLQRGFREGSVSGDIPLVTERFVTIQITTERSEVERTCAVFEEHCIPVLVEHLSPDATRFALRSKNAAAAGIQGGLPEFGFRILTAVSTEQRARALIGRSLYNSTLYNSDSVAV